MSTTTPTSLEHKREERDRREARDRVLAREVGIEIGRRRERDRQHHAIHKAWGRGFAVGFTIAILAFIIALYGASKADARPAAKHQTLGAKHERWMPSKQIQRAIIKIGQCEQPAAKGAGYYANIKWDAFPNGTWPAGLGIMRVHHLKFRPKGTPKDPTKATPAQQIRTAWRAYKYYRRIYGVRGAATFWVCSSVIRPRFGGVTYDGKVIWY